MRGERRRGSLLPSAGEEGGGRRNFLGCVGCCAVGLHACVCVCVCVRSGSQAFFVVRLRVEMKMNGEEGEHSASSRALAGRALAPLARVSRTRTHAHAHTRPPHAPCGAGCGRCVCRAGTVQGPSPSRPLLLLLRARALKESIRSANGFHSSRTSRRPSHALSHPTHTDPGPGRGNVPAPPVRRGPRPGGRCGRSDSRRHARRLRPLSCGRPVPTGGRHPVREEREG